MVQIYQAFHALHADLRDLHHHAVQQYLGVQGYQQRPVQDDTADDWYWKAVKEFIPVQYSCKTKVGTHSGTIRTRRSLLARRSCRTDRTGLTRATGRTSLTTRSSCAIFANGSSGTRGSSNALHR